MFLFLQMALERSSALLTEFMTAVSRLRADFKTVDEYVALASALQDVQARRGGFKTGGRLQLT